MDAEMILLVAIAVCFFAVVYGIVRIVQMVRENRRLAALREEQAAEYAREATRKWREAQRDKAVKNTPPPRTLNTVGSGVNVGKSTYAPSPTQSVNQYQDNFLSDVAMGMVINSLLNSTHDSQSGTVTENRDTGRVDVKVNESSWGFDDSDSRKSISSSMDTSSSSDSWSSSSSDSGPSSDW